MFTGKTSPTKPMGGGGGGGGGGVLLAISKELNSCECHGLDTDCELLWVKIDMVGVKTIHFGAFYRPPNSDQLVLDHLSESLERLVDCTNGNIWLGGDFNAPHIDWPLLDLLPFAGSKRPIYQRLIGISLHHNIEQLVDKPTRGEHSRSDLHSISFRLLAKNTNVK